MKKILATLSILAFTAPAMAQAADFATVDADGSGTVTWEEVQAAMPDVTEEQFQAADADDSGDLSEDEFATLGGG